MSAWHDRVLRDFVPELARLWIVTDPDDVLLDESLLSALRHRGFDVLPFEDSIAFRAELEGRYRSAWREGQTGPASAVILHLKSDDSSRLPWDYLQSAQAVRLSLADLFPKLAPGVTRQVGVEHLERLFQAQSHHAAQVLGEASTKDFALTHVFRLSPHLIGGVSDLWRELLRVHYRENELPAVFAAHMEAVLVRLDAFRSLPIAKLFGSRSLALKVLQDAWHKYLTVLGVTASSVGDPLSDEYANPIRVPFDDPGIWSTVDSMFLEGTLHPVQVGGLPSDFPRRLHVGVVLTQGDLRDLVVEGLKALSEELPSEHGSHRDWLQFARKMGELLSRFHGLDNARFEAVRQDVEAFQSAADLSLQNWVRHHYADLPSLSAVKAPVMVHHVPRFLAMRRDAGEARIALLVFDGLAVDQWARIREHVVAGIPDVSFEETACFAWLPTLTSVSRQAIFSGLKPREFASSIETTAQEPNLWSRFWADHGLRNNEVLFRKGIKHIDQLDELTSALSSPALKVAGIVVDMVDELVHDAQLGKRGVAHLVDLWCETGFVDRLFTRLHELGYHVYLTADHGNVDAIGTGRINQGVAPEIRGERVRTYRSSVLLDESAAAYPASLNISVPGLPPDFLPLFAGPRSAFVTAGEQLVAHGGISVEELIVPFVKVKPAGL